MRDGVLVRAVIVHRPYFLITGTVADKINLAFRDALNSSAQPEDDFIGKLVRDHANRVGCCIVVVLFAEHLG